MAYATKSAIRANSKAPKIKTILETHFKSLISIQSDTLNRYKQLCGKHIIPTLGDVPIDQFTVEEAQKWYKNIQGSAKTKKNVQVILSAAIKTAIEKDLIVKNVVIGLKPGKEISKNKSIFLTEQQVEQLLYACPDQYKLLLEFLVMSGLRWGETTALQRKDLRIDEEQIVVSVDKAWKKMPGGMELGLLKTKVSIGNVSLPKIFSQKLMLCVESLLGGEFIFPNPNTGKVFQNKSFHVLVWKPVLDGCKFFDNPRVHDLLHTHASRFIAAGISLPVIQKRLGYESITTTVNTYGHLALGADREAARALER